MVRILHNDWSISLGENRSDKSSQTFGGKTGSASSFGLEKSNWSLKA